MPSTTRFVGPVSIEGGITGEAALIQRSNANDAWLVVALTASSSTGANIATIV